MHKLTRIVPVSLTMRRFSTSPEEINDGCCVICDQYLDLHQPDPGAPDRLIGVCRRCGTWYLIDTEPESDEALMVLLPDNGFFQDALAS